MRLSTKRYPPLSGVQSHSYPCLSGRDDFNASVYLSLPIFSLYMSGICSIFIILNLIITIHRKCARLLLDYAGQSINHIALFVLALFITTLLIITILSGYLFILLYFIYLAYPILSIYFYDKAINIISLLYKLRWYFFFLISGLFLILSIFIYSDYIFIVESVNMGTTGNNGGSSTGAPSTGGPSTGGPSPGGGGGGPETLTVKGGGLPKSDTSNTLDSNVSYTNEDLEQVVGADMVNMKNIVKDKNLTQADRDTKILVEHASKLQELLRAKMEIARLKKSEVVDIVLQK
jgi:hypothetical protein